MRSSSLAVKLLLCLLSTCLTLGLAEIGARLLLPPPPHVRVLPNPDLDQRLEAENRQPLENRVVRMRPDTGLYVVSPTGKRLRARAHVVIENHPLNRGTVDIRTNSLGFRNREVGPKGTTRVLFLGDSITLADYLPEEQTFVRLVEALSSSTARPLETINAGVGGIGLQDELAVLLETGLRTSPDVVVVGFYLNDAQPSPGIEMIRVPSFLEGSWLGRHVFASLSRIRWGYLQGGRREIRRRQLSEWRQEIARRFPPGPGDPATDSPAFHALVLRDVWDWGGAWSEGAWRSMRPVFKELKSQSNRHGFRLLVVGFPLREQVVANFACDYPQQQLRQTTEALGIPLLDLLPVFRKARRGDARDLFFDGCHHTPQGSRLVAQAILEFLEQQGLQTLPATARRPGAAS